MYFHIACYIFVIVAFPAKYFTIQLFSMYSVTFVQSPSLPSPPTPDRNSSESRALLYSFLPVTSPKHYRAPLYFYQLQIRRITEDYRTYHIIDESCFALGSTTVFLICFKSRSLPPCTTVFPISYKSKALPSTTVFPTAFWLQGKFRGIYAGF